MMTRRFFLASQAGAFLLSGAGFAADRSSCLFGAIRWDAHYSDKPGEPGYEEEQILGPSKWQFRAPIHSRVITKNAIRFEPTQETFDNEIRVAEVGGLSYWAYLAYGKDAVVDLNHPMMRGLDFHRSSTIKSKMKYALIVQTNTLGFAGRYAEAIRAILELLRDSNYMTCLNERPVIYILYSESDVKVYWGASLSHLKSCLNAIREGARRLALGEPYFVLMTAPPAKAEIVREAIGAEAISVYAGPIPRGPHLPFSALEAITQQYWQRELDAAPTGVVPTVMIGWDTRPRKEHPPSWEKGMQAGVGLEDYVISPTPAQFLDECRAAERFIDCHPTACRSRFALIYAWDENSEGGALEPTLGDPSASYLTTASRFLK
jgi:hypothetical protein